VENLEPFPFPVNTDFCSAMRANQVAFVTDVNKPVYGGFFIGKPAVKLIVRHRADRRLGFIGHFLACPPFPKFLGGIIKIKN
jgi:hypothetical protein